MSNKKKSLIKLRFTNKILNSVKKIPSELKDNSIIIKTYDDLLAHHGLSDKSDESNLKIKRVYLLNMISYYIFIMFFIVLMFFSLNSSSIFTLLSILFLAIISLISSLPNLKLCWQIKHEKIGTGFEFLLSPTSILPMPLRNK